MKKVRFNSKVLFFRKNVYFQDLIYCIREDEMFIRVGRKIDFRQIDF